MALLLLILFTLPASADTSGPAILRDVGFSQHLGAAVPGDLAFVDERGETVRLGDYFGAGPIILTLNDFNCPNLCSLELQGLATGLTDLPFTLGADYRVVTVSINPRDTPPIAAEVKHRYVWPPNRLGDGTDWHFLTGDPDGVTQLARAVGFNYAYDAQQEQYAHPTGVVVLSNQGTIASYLYGIDFSSRDLRFALIEASHRQIGSPTDQVLLTCYHYEATLGRYAGLALIWVRVSGALTLALLASGLGVLWWRDLRRGAGSG
jgi:protein SCO1/2